MNKNILEKYIQFAIDNWFSKLNDDFKIKTDIQTQEKNDNDEVYLDETLHWTFIFYWCCDVWCDIISLENIITSKDFIEAVAKWTFCKEDCLQKDLLNELTTSQALAIRDSQLEEFIENLLK